MKIFVDSDSCPSKVRDTVSRAALKRDIETIFVANKKIPFQKNEKTSFVVSSKEEGSADNYIIEKSTEEDLIITRDIPLAYELLKKGATVINDRGEQFTLDYIKSRLSQRDMMKQLYESGVAVQGYKTFGSKELQKFANCFDSILQKKLLK